MRRLLLVAILVCGCSGQPRVDEHRAALPIDQVPKPVLTAAHKRLPDVRFDTAWKLDTGAIQMRGKSKTGKIHAIQLSDAGKVLEVD